MKTCLRPYEGTQPYIFVSYAHKNDAAVLEIIGTLQSRGFRVWYDEGIEAGSEFASANSGCSASSARSSCWRFCPRRICARTTAARRCTMP